MQSRLGELGLQSIDVGVADDCFFRSVSHQCMTENRERFIESNTENSWLRYLNNEAFQGGGV